MAQFTTRAILAATRSPEVHQVPSAIPIYQAAAFSTATAAELGDVLTGVSHGYAYSRIDNPTTAALADAVAELEGAEAGLAFATGMAAIHAAIVSVVRAGQTIVVTQAVYGTTRDLLVRVLAGLGVATEFVDPTDLAAVDAALTRTGSPILYVETVSNPTIIVSDLSALAGIAHSHGALLLVDNTFASPYACRPIEHGADLVMHSATKYLSGHADVLAGVVVGNRERIDAVRPILVDAGGALAPLAAFLVLRGLPTLALRMERHSDTALELAAWLQGQDRVERVYYPGLPERPGARGGQPAARRLRRHVRLRAGRRQRSGPGLPGRHARRRTDGLIGRRPDDHQPSAFHDSPPARRRRSARERHRARPAASLGRARRRGGPARGPRAGAGRGPGREGVAVRRRRGGGPAGRRSPACSVLEQELAVLRQRPELV